MKFKVGDRVKNICDESHWYGQVGTVTRVRKESLDVSFDGEKGYIPTLYTYKFEKVYPRTIALPRRKNGSNKEKKRS